MPASSTRYDPVAAISNRPASWHSPTIASLAPDGPITCTVPSPHGSALPMWTISPLPASNAYVRTSDGAASSPSMRPSAGTAVPAGGVVGDDGGSAPATAARRWDRSRPRRSTAWIPPSFEHRRRRAPASTTMATTMAATSTPTTAAASGSGRDDERGSPARWPAARAVGASAAARSPRPRAAAAARPAPRRRRGSRTGRRRCRP